MDRPKQKQFPRGLERAWAAYLDLWDQHKTLKNLIAYMLADDYHYDEIIDVIKEDKYGELNEDEPAASGSAT